MHEKFTEIAGQWSRFLVLHHYELSVLLDCTEHVVFATDQEKHSLWDRYAHNSKNRLAYLPSMHWYDSLGASQSTPYGNLRYYERKDHNHPEILVTTRLYVQCQWVLLDGHLVMFADYTQGYLAHFTRLERWAMVNVPQAGTNRLHEEAQNFVHVAHVLQGTPAPGPPAASVKKRPVLDPYEFLPGPE